MRIQTSGLCLLLAVLFAFLVVAPHNDVRAVTPQPAVTVTAP